MTREEWNAELLRQGVIDERCAYTMSNIKKAPNGEFGMSLVCICGDTFSVYDTDFNGHPGQLCYRIPLADMRSIKFNPAPWAMFFTNLKFECSQGAFAFSAGFSKGCSGPMPTISSILMELAKS